MLCWNMFNADAAIAPQWWLSGLKRQHVTGRRVGGSYI